jgi:HEAT repeat protein
MARCPCASRLGLVPKNDSEETQVHVELGELGRTLPFSAAPASAVGGILRHRSHENWVAAVIVLGEINDPSVLKPLQGALRDSDPLVGTALS